MISNCNRAGGAAIQGYAQGMKENQRGIKLKIFTCLDFAELAYTVAFPIAFESFREESLPGALFSDGG